MAFVACYCYNRSELIIIDVHMFDVTNIDLEKEIELTKKIAKENNTKERVGDLKYLTEFIRRKEGDQGLKKVKEKLKEMGIEPLDESKFRDLDQVSCEILDGMALISAYLFNWTQEDVIQLGRDRLKMPNSYKFFIKYFSSPEKTLKKASQNWRKHYSKGEINVREFDMKNKKIVFTLENFKTHPIRCVAFLGMFAATIEMILGGSKVKTKETRCPHKGDDYHEFVFSW